MTTHSSSETMGAKPREGSAITRREALSQAGTASYGALSALAFMAVPAALVAFSRTLGAQAPTTVRGVLEFAYLLENLESEFYKAVLGQSATASQNAAFAPVRAQIQSDPRLIASLRQIAKHEAAHVAFLKAQITALGGTPITYTGAEFDFTGGNGSMAGPFFAAQRDPATLLALAQVFEDTGVRAYKGQVQNLMGDDAVLTAALRIHSVEGRHAARIRRLRGVGEVKPFITSTATVTTTGITATGAGTPSDVMLAVTDSGFSRTTGTFAADGFVVGQELAAGGFGNPSNNGVFAVTAVPAAVTTGATSLSATATGYARAAGSFITNGFAVGQEITATGFTNAANNGRSVITAVTATALTVTKATATVAEAAAAGRTVAADSTISVRRTGTVTRETAAAGRFVAATRGMSPAGTVIVTRAYSGETNTIQSGVEVGGLGSNTGGVGGVTEAFDEPLTYDDVIFIIQNFVIGTAP